MEIVLFGPGDGSGDHRFALMCLPLEDEPAGTQPFFSVPDAAAFMDRAVALGARVICPPMDAGGGRFAHFEDPQGATFGVFEWA